MSDNTAVGKCLSAFIESTQLTDGTSALQSTRYTRVRFLMMVVLNILYWNVQRSKHAIIEAVEASRQYDIIALQEPWQNPHLPTAYCPRGSRYQLIYAGEGSRSAILLHKRHEIKNWDATAKNDWCKVRKQEI